MEEREGWYDGGTRYVEQKLVESGDSPGSTLVETGRAAQLFLRCSPPPSNMGGWTVGEIEGRWQAARRAPLPQPRFSLHHAARLEWTVGEIEGRRPGQRAAARRAKTAFLHKRRPGLLSHWETLVLASGFWDLGLGLQETAAVAGG
ncbi:hypothetical protein OsJ_26795 [Oryza sativa Japonica Group]|uniref:Uncharacterized protein n=1 Tax=Oryza sativa subsp. japonica TaxID=39947 RepID=B9G061_ORYSJ|nr:hypothetical protein OsJ_26795 [Oryza sativa Japonica Group]